MSRKSKCESVSEIGFGVLNGSFQLLRYCISNPVKMLVIGLSLQASTAEARYARPITNPAQNYLNRHQLADNIASYLDDSWAQRQAFQDITTQSNNMRRIPTNTEKWQNQMIWHELNQGFRDKREPCRVPPQKPFTDGPTFGRR